MWFPVLVRSLCLLLSLLHLIILVDIGTHHEATLKDAIKLSPLSTTCRQLLQSKGPAEIYGSLLGMDNLQLANGLMTEALYLPWIEYDSIHPRLLPAETGTKIRWLGILKQQILKHVDAAICPNKFNTIHLDHFDMFRSETMETWPWCSSLLKTTAIPNPLDSFGMVNMSSWYESDSPKIIMLGRDEPRHSVGSIIVHGQPYLWAGYRTYGWC